ncbi:MAG: hypothetical protein ACR2OG_11930 [Gemmatimonadaceae bacterium]
MQRATLIVQVAPSLEDSSAVRELGWAGGIVGAQVVVTRNAAGATPQTAITGPTGEATFAQLLTGSYSVSVLRLLAPSETARLSSVNADVNAFGGAMSVSVGAPSTSITLPALGGHRGSLVISELWRYYPRQPNGDEYVNGSFLELYNNSDTSIALADKIVIKGFPGTYDYPKFPCSLYDGINHDPTGIWTGVVHRFPETAPPLAPGRFVTLATDAIDHRPLATGALDLSRADFEFTGTADADNPAVPNMVNLGPDGLRPRGFDWYEVREVVAIGTVLDLSTLPRQLFPNSGARYVVRIPADHILDVLTTEAEIPNPYPKCGPSVDVTFDRQETAPIKSSDPRSLQRRVAFSLPDGRVVLLRTRTSARDFTLLDPTPGSAP